MCAVMERLVRPSWVCVDAGANIGAHTLVLSELAGHVLAFEANPAVYRHLKHNVAGRRNVTAINRALWDQPGRVNIASSPEFAGAGFVTANKALKGSRAARPVGERTVEFRYRVSSVPAIALDSLGLERLDFMKLDVEGAEQHVLDGATETFERCKPILLTEYYPVTAARFGSEPEAPLRRLQELGEVSLIEEDGSLTSVEDWPMLETRLAGGKGWEDLLVSPA